MTNFGADTPFILLAKIIVKEDKVSEYLELEEKIDKAIEAVEPKYYIILLIRIQKILLSLYGLRLIKMMKLLSLTWVIQQ